jgi:cytochrome c-type biogenesis protein CcmH/NrfG
MPEPLNRIEYLLADFDRNQLPSEQRMLQGIGFRKAVQEHYEKEHAELGFFFEIAVTESLISIRWKKEDDQLDMVDVAIGCLTKGDYKRGVALLRFVRRTSRENFNVCLNLGMALSDLGEFAEALECLETATRVSPEQSSAWNGLGVAYTRMGNGDDARRMFEEACRLDPQNPYVLRNLGATLTGQRGEGERARDLLKKATLVAPRDVPAWMGLGRAHEALGELHDADNAYRVVLELVSDGAAADAARKARIRIMGG